MAQDGYVDPHIGHLRARRRRTRARRRDPHPHARDRDRARPPARGAGGAHRRRADRDRARRQRRRACGRRRSPTMVGAAPRRRCRSTTSTSRCRRCPGARAPARHAVLPRHRQPRLRQLGGRRRALRRLRARTRWRAGSTACRGITAPDRAGRHGALRAALEGAVAALPVPRSTPAWSRSCATRTR